MDNKVWLHPQTNLSEALIKQDYDLLIQYAADNEELITEKWHNADRVSTAQTLRYGNSQLKYFRLHLEKSSKENALFRLGTLMGLIETLEHFSHEKDQENLTANIYAKQVLSIRHLKEIIQLLESHGVMNHSEICQNLNLKESTLSEIMKKTDSTNLIASTKAGKYKLYRLTDSGRYLSRQLRSSSTVTYDKEELWKALMYYLKSAPENELFQEKLKQLMDKNSNDCVNINENLAPGNTLTLWNKNTRVKSEFCIDWLVRNNEVTNNSTIVVHPKTEENFDNLINANNY